MLPCWQLIKKCIAKKIRPACIAEKQHISMHSRVRIKLKALLITLIWLTPLQTNPFLTSFNMFFMYQETNTIIIQSMLACLLLWQTVFACKKGIKLEVSHAKIWRIRYINIEKGTEKYQTILLYWATLEVNMLTFTIHIVYLSIQNSFYELYALHPRVERLLPIKQGKHKRVSTNKGNFLALQE